MVSQYTCLLRQTNTKCLVHAIALIILSLPSPFSAQAIRRLKNVPFKANRLLGRPSINTSLSPSTAFTTVPSPTAAAATTVPPNPWQWTWAGGGTAQCINTEDQRCRGVLSTTQVLLQQVNSTDETISLPQTPVAVATTAKLARAVLPPVPLPVFTVSKHVKAESDGVKFAATSVPMSSSTATTTGQETKVTKRVAVSAVPGARCCGHVWHDALTDTTYHFGGFGYGTDGKQGYLSDLWAFHNSNGTFTYLKGPTLGLADHHHRAKLLPDQMFQDNNSSDDTIAAAAASVVSGSGTTRTRDRSTTAKPANSSSSSRAVVLSQDSQWDDSWPRGRMYASYAYDANTRSFWLWSGEGPDNNYYPDMWRLDMSTLEFEHIGDFTESPTPRTWGNSWAGKEGMWLFGGVNADEKLNDFYFFNYSTRSWRRLYAKNTPYGVYPPQSQQHELIDTMLQDSVSQPIKSNSSSSSSSSSGHHRTDSNASSIINTKTSQLYQHQHRGGQKLVREVAPGARHNAFTSVDARGQLWMFGGSGYGSKERGVMSDLWVFDVDQERWHFAGGQPGGVEIEGTCGARGALSTAYLPTARHAGYNFNFALNGTLMIIMGGEHVHETKIFDDLWLVDLGGSSSKSSSDRTSTTAHNSSRKRSQNNSGKHSRSKNSTETVHGSAVGTMLSPPSFGFMGVDCNVANVPEPRRGTLGKGSLKNSPESRFSGNGWIDNAGRAWIFGGGREGYTNDLWYMQPLHA